MESTVLYIEVKGMDILYEDEFMQVRHDEVHNCIEYSWKKFASSEKYKELLDKVYQFLVEKKSDRFLADATLMKAIPQDAQAWTDTDWFPRMIQAGTKFIAVVNPELGGGSMAMRKMREEMEEKTRAIGIIQTFVDTLQKARDFIASH